MPTQRALKVLVGRESGFSWNLLVDKGKGPVLLEPVPTIAGEPMSFLVREFDDEDPQEWLAKVRTDANYALQESLAFANSEEHADIIREHFS